MLVLDTLFGFRRCSSGWGYVLACGVLWVTCIVVVVLRVAWLFGAARMLLVVELGFWFVKLVICCITIGLLRGLLLFLQICGCSCVVLGYGVD